jgi:hypothetical protein
MLCCAVLPDPHLAAAVIVSCLGLHWVNDVPVSQQNNKTPHAFGIDYNSVQLCFTTSQLSYLPPGSLIHIQAAC